MRPINALTLSVVIALQSLLGGCHCIRPLSQPAEAEPVIELFDGSTLSGWIQRGGKAAYTVENGCIVGRTAPNQPNSFLCTTAEYADFVLSLEFKVDSELNSGVQIRSQSDPSYQSGRVHGYQIEIDPGERAWTGGIYEEGRRGWLDDLSENPGARAAFRQGEWNSLRVEAIGERIRTWINDVPAADLHDGMTAAGFIALQVHGVGGRVEPLEVRWRHVRLRPITALVTSQPSAAGLDQSPAPPPSR